MTYRVRDDFLPFSRPSLGDDEIAGVAETLRCGWITSGPRVEAFEQAVADHLGARHAVAFSSATGAFHVLLEALGLGSGDEVITPSFTWPSPVNMIHSSGATPVFADIDRDTLLLDPTGVEAAITGRTRAVLPVHFAGQPCDLDALRGLCGRHGLELIEDAAHALGAEYRGHRIGSGGNPAVFSFHATKNLTTGEGGLVTTDDTELDARLRSLRFHGIRKETDADDSSRRYDVVEPGWKYTLTDIQAAIGLAQLKRFPSLQARREQLARLYDEAFEDFGDLVRPAPVTYPTRHAWHLYTVLVDEERAGLTRHSLRDELRRRNIGTGLHYHAVHRLAFYRTRHPESAGRLPATEWAADRICSLPFFPDMSDADVEDVVEAIRDVLAASR